MNDKTSTQQTTNRVLYLDLLRVLASFAVIVLHVSAQNMGDSCDLQWSISNIFDSMTRWCVPMFVMISGALFLDPNKHISYKTIYTKNIVRIIVAFIFWSIIYAIYCHLTFQPLSAFGLISEVMVGHFHLWFLYMIIGVYITIPIMREIAANQKLTKYFLLLSFIFAICLPTFIELIDLIPILHPIGKLFNNIFTTFDFNIAAGFLGYFLLGHYLHTTNFSQKTENIFIVFGVVSYILIATLTYLIFDVTSDYNKLFYNYISPFVMFEAIAVFILIRRLKLHNQKINESISQLAKLSFGIYLIHMLALYIIESIGLNANIVTPIIGIPIIAIIVFVLSCSTSFILSKIPYINKYIV